MEEEQKKVGEAGKRKAEKRGKEQGDGIEEAENEENASRRRRGRIVVRRHSEYKFGRNLAFHSDG